LGTMPRDLHLIRKVIWFRVFANIRDDGRSPKKAK
jgi:hypothetical protein